MLNPATYFLKFSLFLKVMISVVVRHEKNVLVILSLFFSSVF